MFTMSACPILPLEWKPIVDQRDGRMFVRDGIEAETIFGRVEIAKYGDDRLRFFSNQCDYDGEYDEEDLRSVEWGKLRVWCWLVEKVRPQLKPFQAYEGITPTALEWKEVRSDIWQADSLLGRLRVQWLFVDGKDQWGISTGYQHIDSEVHGVTGFDNPIAAMAFIERWHEDKFANE